MEEKVLNEENLMKTNTQIIGIEYLERKNVGAVAQLGERVPCTDEVAGSTPVSSTTEDWDMLPDVEDLEKIVDRELKKLEEWENENKT